MITDYPSLVIHCGCTEGATPIVVCEKRPGPLWVCLPIRQGNVVDSEVPLPEAGFKAYCGLCKTTSIVHRDLLDRHGTGMWFAGYVVLNPSPAQ